MGGTYKDDFTPIDFVIKVNGQKHNLAKPQPRNIPNTNGPADGKGQDLTLIRDHQDQEILRRIELYKQKQFQDLYKDDPKYEKREKPEVYVKNWVDYTHKYGFGYTLSNDTTGVTFNDDTKMILDDDFFHLSYYAKDPDTGRTGDSCTCHTLGTHPEELQKKVRLMQHFWSFLNGNESWKTVMKMALEILKSEDKIGVKKEHNHGKLMHVKKWNKTKHAMVFHLSNKVVQLVFNDTTQIQLASDGKHLTYLNKKGNAKIYKLEKADALKLDQINPRLTEEQKAMVKRLAYTKSILNSILAKEPNYQPAKNLINSEGFLKSE